MRVKLEEVNDSLLERLRKGELFVVPTETVVGLGGVVSGEVKFEICRFKGRDPSKPLAIVFPDFESFSKSVVWEDFFVEKFARTLFDSSITLVLPARDTRRFGTFVGIRCTSSENLRKFARVLGVPFYLTSYNRSGEPPEVRIEEVKEAPYPVILWREVPSGRPTPVVKFSSKGVEVLR